MLELYDFPMHDILEKQGHVKHAGEAETSLMLHLYPQKVRMDKMEDFVIPFSSTIRSIVPGSPPGC